MNRNEWKFAYTADAVLVAARKKEAYHAGRLEWWTAKQQEVKELIKAEGIEIDESLAFDGKLHHSNYGRQATVQIRDDLVRDLNETVQKIAEHRKKTGEYRGWVQVLESQGKASLDLHQDDWLYFFGK